MTDLASIISIESVAEWAVQTGVIVTILILFVLIVRRPFARLFGARAAYALWLLPVLRLFMPTIVLPAHWLPQQSATAPMPSPKGFDFDFDSAAPSLPNIDLSPVVTDAPFDWTLFLVIFWVVIGLAWLIFQLRMHSVQKRALITQSDTANPDVMAMAKKAADDLGLARMPAHIIVSPHVRGPVVTGLNRPVIALPQDFQTQLNSAQQYFALVHELAHIKRRDLWAAMGALIFRAVNWPNPIVHFAAHKFRTDQEAACDAAVIAVTGGQARSYAETLLQSAKFSAVSDNARSSKVRPLGLTLGLTPTDPMTASHEVADEEDGAVK